MTRTSATYTHSTIGFPAISLKWHEENGVWLQPYVTIHGIIQPSDFLFSWRWKHNNAATYALEEMTSFDSFVRKHFADDASVQG